MSTKYLRQFSYPAKIYRRRRLKFKFILIALLILAAGFLIWYLFDKEVFNAGEIKVIGADDLSLPIKEAAGDFIFQGHFSYKNNLLVSSKNLSEILAAAFLELDTIEIDKNFLKKELIIKVSKRKETGILCKSDLLIVDNPEQAADSEIIKEEKIGPCFWFDKSGFLFKETPELIGSLILRIIDRRPDELKSGSKTFSENELNVFVNFKESAKKYLNLEIANFLIVPDFYPDLIAKSAFGFEIYFDKDRYEEALIKLKEALEKKFAGKDLSKIKYFDLRIENRVYYK